MACRTGCPTKNCASYGACLRAARIQIDRHGLQHRNLELEKDKRLSRYEDARRQGLQPKSTEWSSIRDSFEHGGREQTPIVGE